MLTFLPTHVCVTLSFFLVKQVQEAQGGVKRNPLTSQFNILFYCIVILDLGIVEWKVSLMAREECKNDQRILQQPARNAQKAASGPSNTATTEKRGSQAFLS